MKSGRVRSILIKFIKDIYPGDVNKFIEQKKDIIKELTKKLLKNFKTEEEILEYLEYVLNDIDSLNEFFRKKRKRPIKYSSVSSFANKDDRIANFVFDKNLKTGKMKDKLAGKEMVNGNNHKSNDVIYKNEVYTEIFCKKNKFFFSPVTNKIVVLINNGKIIQYSKYVKILKGKDRKYIGLNFLYEMAKLNKDCSASKFFCEFIEKEVRRRKK